MYFIKNQERNVINPKYINLPLFTYNSKSCMFKNGIPLQVFQTFKKDIPYDVKIGMKKLRDQNKNFNFYFYDDNDVIKFIKDNFDNRFIQFE